MALSRLRAFRFEPQSMASSSSWSGQVSGFGSLRVRPMYQESYASAEVQNKNRVFMKRLLRNSLHDLPSMLHCGGLEEELCRYELDRQRLRKQLF